MDESTKRDYSAWAILGAIILVALISASVFLGGQTTRILSTVGSAVNTTGNVDSGVDPSTGSSTDTGGDPAANGGTNGGPQVADAAAGVPTLLIVRTGTL